MTESTESITVTIIIPKVLKPRFEKVLEELPSCYKTMYNDFERFIALSLELSIQALERTVEFSKKIESENRKLYGS
jgi:hypothetical protein